MDTAGGGEGGRRSFNLERMRRVIDPGSVLEGEVTQLRLAPVHRRGRPRLTHAEEAHRLHAT